MIADAVNVAGTELNLRPASLVMQLPRLGSFHQCRISFMRSLDQAGHERAVVNRDESL